VFKRADVIRTRMGEIRGELDELEQKPDDEVTDEDSTRSTSLLDEWDTLDAELKPLEEQEKRLESVRARMLEAANREPGFGAPEVVTRTRAGDPFRGLPERITMLGSTDIRTHAASALKVFSEEIPKAGTDLVGAMLEYDPTDATAEFVLATSDPLYRSAFMKWFKDPVHGTTTWSQDEALAYQRTYSVRAAMSLTPANGGYLVPFTLDPTVILTNASSANPWRQYASVKTTSTNNWNGVTSAGVNAEWSAEAAEASDASPTVAQFTVTPQKADVYVVGSYEVLADTDFAQQFPTLLVDAKDRLEETAFAIGTGTGQPKGAITAGTVLAPTGSAAGPRIADVYNLQNALPARFRGPRSNVAWVAALPTINATRQLAKFTGSTDSMVDDSTDTPRMLGKPVLESSSVSSTFANGNKVLAYGDLSQYVIVDRIGVQLIYDPLVLGPNSTNRRPTGQGAYYAYWRTGGDLAVPTAIRVLSLTT
jgi:HK97 family phage major capsid protein